MTTQNGNPANHLFAYAVEEYDAANGKKAKGTIEIDFYSNEDLDRLMERLGVARDEI